MNHRRLFSLLVSLLILPSLHAHWVETPYGFRWDGEGAPPARSALKGTFYDMRRQPNGKLRPEVPAGGELYSYKKMAQEKMTILRELLQKNHKRLKKYYRSPINLYATNLFVPMRDYRDAGRYLKKPQAARPHAHEDSDIITEDDAAQALEKKLSNIHGGWLSIYTGNVTAPKTGQFRFVGVADDCMLVFFNNKMVLECGYDLPSFFTGNNTDECIGMGRRSSYQEALKAGNAPKHKGYGLLPLKSTPKLNSLFGGFIAGLPFKVKEGEAYPITVIHIDHGGGSGMYLMLQESLGDSQYSPLALFRTDSSLPATVNETSTSPLEAKPRISNDSPVWDVPREAPKEGNNN